MYNNDGEMGMNTLVGTHPVYVVKLPVAILICAGKVYSDSKTVSF